MVRASTIVCCALALLFMFTGCASPQERVDERRTQISTPPITHIVLIELKDPTRAQEFIEDCNRSLPGIPAVQAYACGQPLPSDRPNVMQDYSVGFFVAFEDEAGYKAYLEDPAQLALVDKWRTSWKGVRIFRFLDAPLTAFTPPPAVPAAAGAATPAGTPAPQGATPAQGAPQPGSAPPPPAVPPPAPPAPGASPASPAPGTAPRGS